MFIQLSRLGLVFDPLILASLGEERIYPMTMSRLSDDRFSSPRAETKLPYLN
jgi:hypothetical protein